MTVPIVDTRLLSTEMSVLFGESTCDIQSATETRSGMGAVTSTWPGTTVNDDIPCVVSPAGGQEIERPGSTPVVADFVITLKGAYSAITKKMRAVVTGVNSGTYDIEAVETDPSGTMTQLLVTVVS